MKQFFAALAANLVTIAIVVVGMILLVIGIAGFLCLAGYAAYAYATGRLKRQDLIVSAEQQTF